MVSALPSIFRAPSISVLVPKMSIPNSSVCIPFVCNLVTLTDIIIIRRFSRKVLSIHRGVPVGSVKLLLFFVLPKTFIRPSRGDLVGSGGSSGLEICTTNSVTGIALTIVTVLLISLVSVKVPRCFTRSKVTVSEVITSSPSSNVLGRNVVLRSVSGRGVGSSRACIGVMGSFGPNSGMAIRASRNDCSMILNGGPGGSSMKFFKVRTTGGFMLLGSDLKPVP